MADRSVDDHIDMDLGAWNKMCSTITKAGFRDGAAAGRDAVFQKGFDMGYAEGYQAALSLGYLKGVISTIFHHTEAGPVPAASSLKTTLEKTSIGMCQLCQTDPTKIQEREESTTTKPMSDIIENQRHYVKDALDRIQQDNFQLLNEWSVALKKYT